jgi:hypothetical protein
LAAVWGQQSKDCPELWLERLPGAWKGAFHKKTTSVRTGASPHRMTLLPKGWRR